MWSLLLRAFYTVSSVVLSVPVLVAAQFRSERAVYLHDLSQFSLVLSTIQSETWTKRCVFYMPWL
jgi:hypothetical protein